MNWEAIGAIGEITGALAVVVSLIYLGTQIRSGNRLARNNSNQEVMYQYVNVFEQIASSSESSDLFLQGLMDDSSLSDSQKYRFRVLLVQVMLAFDRIYHLEKEDEIDAWILEGCNYLRKQMAVAPGVKSWFKDRRNQLSKEFQKVFEQEMNADLEYKAAGIKSLQGLDSNEE